jgi:hypothetical protein
MESLKKMEDKFDAKLDMIIFQINKVAVLEEKHTYQAQALGRAFEKLGNIEVEVDRLDKFRAHIEGMAKMAWLIWGSLGLSVGAILVKLYSGGS